MKASKSARRQLAQRQVGRRTALDIAQSILIFILLDQRRLDRFLASKSLTEAELRLGMTHWPAMLLLQHVLDNDDVRGACAAAGVFMSQFEEAAKVHSPDGASTDSIPPLGLPITLR